MSDPLWEIASEAYTRHWNGDRWWGHSAYVYSIRVTGSQYTKIGMAKAPWDRIKTLQNGCPYKLILEGGVYTKSAKALEEAAHKALKKMGAHIRGEWFDVDRDTALALLRALRTHIQGKATRAHSKYDLKEI